MKEMTVEKAVATLIGSTRRKNRPNSIAEIAEIIEFLRVRLGSYKAVGEAVGLSTEMLREFRSVERLSPYVKGLVAERVVDSVDLVYRISKLDAKGQRAVVQQYLESNVTGDDARAIKSYKQAGRRSTSEAIKKIRSSRDIRHYVLEFPLPKGGTKGKVRECFAQVVGKSEIVSVQTENKTARLSLSQKGQKKLRTAAKKAGKSLRTYVTNLLKEK